MVRKLKELFNLTLSIGYFPRAYKIAILCLIQKEGKNPTDPINYRPISLLEVTGKILERIINDRLVKYLEENGIMNNNQYGFRRGRGTQLALATLYETIALSQKEKHGCNVVCRDVKKAFDKVWHSGLKYKILRLNLPDIFEKILCSFLEERIAKIKIGDYVGPPIRLQSGVPQGSILSPTLYILFIADMPEPGPGCYVVGFADDITQVITYPGKSKLMLARRTSEEIKKINDYEKSWKIQTSKEKFKLISISALKPEQVMVDQQAVRFSNTSNILGLNISSRGISAHVILRERKARGQLQQLKRFKKTDTSIQLHLYKTLVRPIMEYPAVPICISAKSNIKKLQTVQNIAIRSAARERRFINCVTNEELHQRLNINAMNVRLHNMATKTWQKLADINPQLIQKAEELRNRVTYEHGWWPTITQFIHD